MIAASLPILENTNDFFFKCQYKNLNINRLLLNGRVLSKT